MDLSQQMPHLKHAMRHLKMHLLLYFSLFSFQTQPDAPVQFHAEYPVQHAFLQQQPQGFLEKYNFWLEKYVPIPVHEVAPNKAPPNHYSP